MRGTIAILCLFSVAVAMGIPNGDGPPGLKFLLEEFLTSERSQFVKGVLAGQCVEIYDELNIQAPPPPPPTEGPETRKLSSLLARYLHRQKRGAVGPTPDQEKALEFCFRFMFDKPEAP